MERGSTFFLRGVIILMGAIVLAFCIFAVHLIVRGASIEFPAIAPLEYPIRMGLYATALPFFFALYQALKLLNYIDKKIAFSELSVKALRYIKYSAITMSALYLLGMPVIVLIAESDDAPGLVLIGLALACSPIIVAVFAAVLQKLLKHAIDIKSENDLVV